MRIVLVLSFMALAAPALAQSGNSNGMGTLSVDQGNRNAGSITAPSTIPGPATIQTPGDMGDDYGRESSITPPENPIEKTSPTRWDPAQGEVRDGRSTTADKINGAPTR